MIEWATMVMMDWRDSLLLQVLRHRSRRPSKQGLNIESFGRLHQEVEERPAEEEAIRGQDQTAGCAKQKAPVENPGTHIEDLISI